MKKNMGKMDRIIRVVVGLVLVGNVFTGLQTPLGWVGVILIATALFSFCPAYLPLKLDTRTAAEKVGLQ